LRSRISNIVFSETRQPSCSDRGFTLVEIAIVLVILGLIFNQIVPPFATQLQQRKRQHTSSIISEVLDAAVGYAIAKQRLPCPAGDLTQGHQREQCTGQLSIGYVPAVTLGIGGGTDSKGRLLDSWGRPLIFAVSDSDHATRGEKGKADFLTAGEMSSVGLPYLESDLEFRTTIA